MALTSPTFSSYPEKIDDENELPVTCDGQTPVVAEVVNRLRSSILAVEGELGVLPSGVYGTVRERLDKLEFGGADVSLRLGSIDRVLEEGSTVRENVKELNFIGPGVTATSSATPDRVDITVTATGGGGDTVFQIQESLAVTVNGQTAFTLSQTPQDDSAVEMYVNGFKQEFGTDYTVSGTSVTFTGSLVLLTSDDVEFWYIGASSSVTILQEQEVIAVTFLGQVAFVLSDLPIDDNAVKMFVNGQKQEHGTDYNVSGSAVTYSGPFTLNTSDVVEFWYITSGVSSAGNQTLSQTLSIGNTTGGFDIRMSSGDVINSATGTVTVDDDLTVNGKLTVTGLIDPTGLVLVEQATVPGGSPSSGEGTFWIRSADSRAIFTNDSGTTNVIAYLSDVGGGGGSQTLAQTLDNGNITDGYDIDFSATDNINLLGDGDNFTISYSSVTSSVGGAIIINAQDSDSEVGGEITLQAGDGYFTGKGGSGGGDVSILAGLSTEDHGGYVYVIAGDGDDTGGNVVISAGDGTGSGGSDGGEVNISSGNGDSSDGDSGAINITTPESLAGISGDIVISTGDATENAGTIAINPGDCGSGVFAAGSFIVLAGTNGGDAASTAGNISLTAGTASGGSNGGLSTLKGGLGSGASTAGNAVLEGGGSNAGADAGKARVVGGTALSSGAGGDVEIVGGTADSGDGGNVAISSGATSSGAAGDITLTAVSGTTTDGNISFDLTTSNDDGYIRLQIDSTDALTMDSDGVLFLANAQSVPGIDPFSGGLMYSEGGAGKWRSPSGTITTFGPADPHCQRCGRDFALESKNAAEGWAASVCIPCLINTLDKAGISRDEYVIEEEGLQ